MQKIDLEDLLRKYRDNSISEDEQARLENWYVQWKPGHQHLELDELEEIKAGLWNKLPYSAIRKPKPFWLGIAAAASVVIALTVGGYFMLRPNSPRQYAAAPKNEILPGGSKAILTLANGSTIDLNEARNGDLAKTAGMTITKNDSGQVSYVADSSRPAPGNHSPTTAYNTITTPKGGQWHIVLADGTEVWLNAASSLHYPASFNGTERKVELTGEGYFEVAKDKAHPFIVATDKQEVEVLGTHFNINSYNDEVSVKTTLLEGSVRVGLLPPSSGSQPSLSEGHLSQRERGTNSQSVVLKPGQQASLVQGKLNIEEVDSDDAIAWKNGKFVFADEGISSIMRKVSRWYDVDVVYNSLPEQDSFSGSISRFETIQQVLNKIELTNKIHFKVKGRRITVSR
jgi:ferric-dicitrate binding protein FerR (iron transport regulator)